MPEVEILLLGTPRIERAGRPLVTDTRKATALLAYLAVTEKPASRDRLSDLLWPEAGQSKARAALRRTLSALSDARSEGWLIVNRDHVSLDGAHVFTDVNRFHALLADKERDEEETLSEAVELYRDDFMAGFSLRDSAVFDDWLFFEGESLRQKLALALERLSWIESTKGDWEEATSHARRWLSLDRLHEPAHRRLMEVHARAGRRSAALKQYSDCKKILSSELGVSPLEATTRLYGEIRRDALPPQQEIHEPPQQPWSPQSLEDGSAVRRTNTLFGREAEWGEMNRAFEAGSGIRVVLLEGEAGIGKTRLAEEFLSRAASEGATTLAVHCYESEQSVAYGPFVQALAQIAADPGLHSHLSALPQRHLVEASRLLPEISGGEEPASLDSLGARSRLFEGITQVISAICSGESPGILFVDDVHLCDASSLELMAYLTRRLEKLGGMRVILTYRSGGGVGDVTFGRFRSEMRKTGGMVEIHIGRLDRRAVEEMAAAIGETSPEIGRRLFEETEGVPLFVDEYLQAISTGDLPVGDEAWLPPGGVRDVILSRLENVGETARQILGAAAAVGRSFDFDTVREASGRGEEEVLEAIEELIGGAVISEVRDAPEGDATYDFSHGRVRELVYEHTSLARRRILHRRIAGHLAGHRSVHRRETTSASARIAHHYRLAGQDEEAARYFYRAGEESRSLYANTEALAHFEAALALGHPEEDEIYEEIGDLQTLGGDYRSALASYGTSLSGGESIPDTVRLQRKLGDVYQRLGEWEQAERCYGEAMSALENGDGGSLDLAMLHADLSLLFHSRRDNGEASRHAEESLRLADVSGDALALARTHNIAAMISRGAGESDEARRHIERSLTLSDEARDSSMRVAALNNLALVLGEAGETESAISTATEALTLCEKLGDRHREAALRNNLADLCHAAGREEESREHFRKAVEIFAEIGGEDLLQPGIWRLVEW